MSASKLLVTTLCIGERFTRIGALTHPLFKEYAAKVGADFSVITERRVGHVLIHWEKYQLRDLLSEYDRILFLDTDIVLQPGSPDIFRLVPDTMLGVSVVSNCTNGHDTGVAGIQRDLGSLDWRRIYFNSGVMLLSNIHKPIFDLRLGMFSGKGAFEEQTQLNYNVRKLAFKIFDLGPKYNHTPAAGFSHRFSSYFIHYCGFSVTDALSKQVKSDLMKLGLCLPPTARGYMEKYRVLELQRILVHVLTVVGDNGRHFLLRLLVWGLSFAGRCVYRYLSKSASAA